MVREAAESWGEHASETLRRSGHRVGGARQAVVELLAWQRCCLSAQEISAELRRPRGGVGKASVYRALDVLHGLGLVQRVDLGDGEVRFEPILPGGEHHHHAVCGACGKVTAFEDDRLEADLERLATRLGHSIETHELVIHGSCKGCASASGR